MTSILFCFGALIAYVGGGGALVISLLFETVLNRTTHLTILYIGFWAVWIGGGIIVLAIIMASIMVIRELRQEIPQSTS